MKWQQTDRDMVYSSKHKTTVFEIQPIGTYTPRTPPRAPPDKHKMSLDQRKNLFVLDKGHGSYNFRQTNFKDFSKIFPGQIITVFKDYDLFNKSALFNSFLNTLLAKTRHGVIYDFYFFSHGCSHYITLLCSAK